ncbi:aldolase/citrate lyase family protein [soil metagenome]
MAPFKQRLRAGETVSLVNVDHAHAGLVHYSCGLGIDAVMLDCEQGTPGFEDIENLTRAAHLQGVASIVRVPSSEPWTIERYMMRGVDGIVVPRLDTAEQVRRVVDDIRYAVPLRFEHKSVIVQVESVSAVEQLDDFMSVEEVDCFFIGAVDLAKSMGFAGDYRKPAVATCIDEVIARIRARGRSVGFMVRDQDAAVWQAKGVTMLYAHINDFLTLGARQWRADAGLKPA